MIRLVKHSYMELWALAKSEQADPSQADRLGYGRSMDAVGAALIAAIVTLIAVWLGGSVQKGQWLRTARREAYSAFLLKIDNSMRAFRVESIGGPRVEERWTFAWSEDLAQIALLGPERVLHAAEILAGKVAEEQAAFNASDAVGRDFNAPVQARHDFIGVARGALGAGGLAPRRLTGPYLAPRR